MNLLSITDRYIAKHILQALLMVLVVVVGLLGLVQFLEELEDVNDSYTRVLALLVVISSLPSIAYQMLPLIVIVGTVLGLGNLASSSELTVIRAAGISTARIMFSCVKPVLIIAIIAMAASEFGIPQAQGIAKSLKIEALSKSGSYENQKGGWYKQGNEFIHISAVDGLGKIYGITRYLFDDENRLIAKIESDSGVFGSNGAWHLRNNREIYLESDFVTKKTSTELNLRSDLDPELLMIMLTSPNDLPITGLFEYSNYLLSEGVNVGPYQLAFWSKLFHPLATISLVIMGAAFIFGSIRSVPIGQRILIGILIGFSFRFLQELLAPASQVIGFSPLLAALAPIILTLIFALFLFWRIR